MFVDPDVRWDNVWTVAKSIAVILLAAAVLVLALRVHL